MNALKTRLFSIGEVLRVRRAPQLRGTAASVGRRPHENGGKKPGTATGVASSRWGFRWRESLFLVAGTMVFVGLVALAADMRRIIARQGRT